jgi:hypothetical protein
MRSALFSTSITDTQAQAEAAAINLNNPVWVNNATQAEVEAAITTVGEWYKVLNPGHDSSRFTVKLPKIAEHLKECCHAIVYGQQTGPGCLASVMLMFYLASN